MAWHPFRNVGLKIAALGLGTLLWFTVSGQQVERTIRAPIEYSHVPAALQITGDQTDSVFVHVRGAENQISRIGQGDVRAMLDLAGAHPVLRGTFVVRPDQIVVPFGVEVMWVDPPEITLTLQRAGSAIVPVRADVVGKPAAGFVVGTVTVDPATVEVVGPESQLLALDHASTARVVIDGASATVTQAVNVMVPDSALRLSAARVAHVTVQIVKAKNP